MDAMPVTSTCLRLLIAATFVVQIGLLAAAPIPSPVATRRVVRRRRYAGGSPPGDGPGPDHLAALLPPLAALAGLCAVLVAVVFPGATHGLVPAGTCFPIWLAAVGCALLLAGNGLVAAAALTLKRRTAFGPDGQSTALVTGGIFGWVRHPIVLGLGLIYLGFFLTLPSPLVLAGLLCFGWHQQRRLAAEEALLANRFGRQYRDYRGRVGGLWPRRPGGLGA